MPPKKHAILSASSSHRWLNCNPSARLEQEFEDRTSEAAEEGTAAHALAEHKLRKALKMRSTRPVSKYDSDEMEAYTDGYVEFVLEALEEAKQQCSDPLVMIEQRLDFSCYVPDGFGTGDCLIVADHILHIIDFKYGMVNPIVDWTDDDVWEFLHHYGCKSNPLYECGFKRIGCIGCPMAGKHQRESEFERYPGYKKAYIHAFEKMLDKRRADGKDTIWESGQEVFDWWING